MSVTARLFADMAARLRTTHRAMVRDSARTYRRAVILPFVVPCFGEGYPFTRLTAGIAARPNDPTLTRDIAREIGRRIRRVVKGERAPFGGALLPETELLALRSALGGELRILKSQREAQAAAGKLAAMLDAAE